MSLIVAFDRTPGPDRAAGVVEALCGEVAGFKVGLPYILMYGLREIEDLRDSCPKGLWIGDLKLADIASTMKATVEAVGHLFDAVIAHSAIGYKGALDGLSEYLRSRGINLILVATMSHPGATEFYDLILDRIPDLARRLQAWGLVAPATRLHVIKRLRESLGASVRILSPGVGAQGARPGDALCAGADYEIVGRAITQARDPISAALEILESQRRAVESCRARA